MNKQRLAVLIAAAVGVLASFMPWVKAPFVGSVSGINGADGWINLVLFAIPLALCLLKDKTQPLTGALLYGAIVPSIVALLMGVWKIVDFQRTVASMNDPENPFAQALCSSVSIEFGLYLVVLAGIALPILAFVVKDKKVVSE